MKCIRCEKDCTLNERKDGKCPHCGGRFALEPRSGDKLSDGLLQGSIKAVSADGKVRWHLENLYYEVCRKKGPSQNNTYCLGCLGWGCFNYIAVGLLHGPLEFVALVLGALAIGGATHHLAKTRFRPGLFPRQVFNKEWSRWAEVHGTPPSMIVPAPRTQDSGRKVLESDLADYSFDRAVICDRAETVDLLVANNFHFENNCAVLTASGYPPQAFDAVKGMLSRNPRLKVWVLHDASPEGCSLAHRLKQRRDWFAEGVTIIDAGLRPANAQPLRKLWEPAQVTKEDLDGPAFAPEEAQWLRQHRLALAAIRPEQIVKRLFRSISADPAGWVLVGGVYVDKTSFSADASTSDGGGDSFG